MVAAAFLIACGGEFEEPIYCEDQCPDCEARNDFDVDRYDPECSLDAPGQSPDFCGLPSSGDDCIEPDFEIEESTVADLHDALQSGDVSCEWVTTRYYHNILWHDLAMTESTPPLNAFVHLNDAVLDQARTLDTYQRCEQELAGPLHCVPFAIKDNYASQEIPISAGSLALGDPQPHHDAFSVERIRRAGALMIGSTALDELARGVHGLSGRSGKTANPYRRTYNSGGSSSGSAVATTTNMTMAALGTDNCSSLMMPAAYNGLFSMRSSIGLVSTEGIYPSNRLDVIAGPMTRTATDLALFLDSMTEFNARDHRHCSRQMDRHETYTQFLDVHGLQDKRIGVLRTLGDGDDTRHLFGRTGTSAATGHFNGVIDELRDLGAQVVDDIALSDFNGDRRSTGQGVDVDRFLENTTGGVSTHREFCKTRRYSAWLFDTVDDCLDRADQTVRNLESRIESGRAQYADNRRYVQQYMDDHNLDALFYPADTRGGASRRARSNNCILPSVTGLPTVTVPTGFDANGLPVGMVFTARLYDEPTLFEIAYGYEQATEHRRPPEYPLGKAPRDKPPPVDANTFNDLHLEMGRAGFDAVLGHSDKYELTAELFTELTRQVLEQHGFDEYILGI